MPGHLFVQFFVLLRDLEREIADAIRTKTVEILNFFKDQTASESKDAFVKIWNILET